MIRALHQGMNSQKKISQKGFIEWFYSWFLLLRGEIRGQNAERYQKSIGKT